ncbi:MAG: hypothetical protein US50_C0038G0017 [Candidatus Nomurabacteria bacterium GW2011_GWB1_37_5]|uniref:Uncharacterized protein n=1 Tax=Candidatus Nomurabacteria bacterium GW2011_GWB1_37_5 TaxID=1618742 RepID=A0A0G0GXJ1_9BACT|nr:MAG: hypothetical protein US50_C0038G0017 [Candidatus Nomurabacteria bacterium GW2011_GWB1_37_5]
MKTNKGFANIVLIIIIVLVLGGAGYLVVKNQQGVQKNGSEDVVIDQKIPPVEDTLSCTPTDSPSITVLSPNGGEVFQIGGQMSVQWSSCNVGPGSVGIELIPAPATIPYPETYPLVWTYDDGVENVTLNVDLLGRQIPPGSYKLSIPQPPETPPAVEDMSDDFFLIQ